ncbi:MAG TPA: hypothetical protein VGM53_23650 [Streptosporangiaceae bacterium]
MDELDHQMSTAARDDRQAPASARSPAQRDTRLEADGPTVVCQTSWVGKHTDLLMSQITSPEQVTPGLRRQLTDCWILVSNAGGAAGFPLP